MSNLQARLAGLLNGYRTAVAPVVVADPEPEVADPPKPAARRRSSRKRATMPASDLAPETKAASPE